MTEIQNDLIRQINFHVQKVQAKIERDESFWQQVVKEFPQFYKETKAYRAVTEVSLDNIKDSLLKRVGSSWASDYEGLTNFLTLIDDSDDYSFVLVEGTIKAFDLHQFAFYLRDNSVLQLPQIALEEKELILLELIEYQIKGVKTLDQIKHIY